MTPSEDQPQLPEPPAYSPYMSRDEAHAVLQEHLDLVKPWEEDPNPDVRAFVAQQRRDAEAAFKRLEGFYEIGADA
ncbi:MAG: hypothetical protein EON52_13690, partial [Actinomycetales bacterium]